MNEPIKYTITDLFNEAHNELIHEHLQCNPNSTWDIAFKKTIDLAYARMIDNVANQLDALVKQRRRNGPRNKG